MIGMRLEQTKAGLFDRDAVLKAVERAERGNMSKLGAFTRRRAKSIIKDRKKGTAQPGDPPFSHEGSLKRLIFFAYDSRSRSVVIGPLLFRDGGAELEEYGGDVTRERKGKSRRLHYRPHPFMRPAFEEAQGKVPEIWSNSVR